MRVLILGGSGFLGSHVVDRFLATGHKVTVYDLARERFRRTPDAIEYIDGDLGNVGTLEELVATGFDVVLHFISTTTPKSSNESPEFDIQSNVIGTVRFLDLCVKHKIPKVVFLSSGGTVYGNIGDIASVDESYPVRPICSYGISKLSVEHYLHLYRHMHGLNYVCLRISNPYGERQNPSVSLGALTVFLFRTLKRQTIEVWGDGSVTRDFIYVGDVANAVFLAATLDVGGVFNVGSGVGLSLRDLLREISQAVEIAAEIKWLKPRPYDVGRIVLDSSKLQRMTGWRCTTSLQEGISRTAQWLATSDLL